MKRLQQTKQVLGSEGVLTLVVRHEAQALELFAILWQTIADFEQRFSRFLPDSELTKVNQNAGHPTDVSAEFLALLQTAKMYARKTDGLYNPFILPALQRSGYAGSWTAPKGEIPAKSTQFTDANLASYEDILFDGNTVTIPANTALDFGGIGKGYLLDLLADSIDTKGQVGGYWLSLGGDIVCAGYNLDNKPWDIGVQQADGKSAVAQIHNKFGKRMAVASSGITKRQGVHEGRAWHHIIDPRTGAPAATDILTATVSVLKAVEADVFAKCMVIATVANAATLAETLHIRDYLLQTTQREIIMQGREWT